jgi:ribosomal subunit interface protein
MQLPLEITARDVSLSGAIEADIQERADKLNVFYDRIMRCRVILEGVTHHHRKGGPYNVRIYMTVPGGELVINRQTDQDLYVAIRKAFDAAGRRLEDYARRQRGDTKTHTPVPYARVSKLFPEVGYGFLETPDGLEVYFHRNSVLDPGFDRLHIGMQVRFTQEMGEKGPQASTVTIVGKNHG